MTQAVNHVPPVSTVKVLQTLCQTARVIPDIGVLVVLSQAGHTIMECSVGTGLHSKLFI